MPLLAWVPLPPPLPPPPHLHPPLEGCACVCGYVRVGVGDSVWGKGVRGSGGRRCVRMGVGVCEGGGGGQGRYEGGGGGRCAGEGVRVVVGKM